MSQVRRGHGLARAAETRTALLDLTFHSAARAARRVRRESGYLRGGASGGGAVARTLAARFGPTRSKRAVRILVLGAAARMAGFGGEAAPWTALDSTIPTVDAVAAATSGRLSCLDSASLAGRAIAVRGPRYQAPGGAALGPHAGATSTGEVTAQ